MVLFIAFFLLAGVLILEKAVVPVAVRGDDESGQLESLRRLYRDMEKKFAGMQSELSELSEILDEAEEGNFSRLEGRFGFNYDEEGALKQLEYEILGLRSEAEQHVRNMRALKNKIQVKEYELQSLKNLIAQNKKLIENLAKGKLGVAGTQQDFSLVVGGFGQCEKAFNQSDLSRGLAVELPALTPAQAEELNRIVDDIIRDIAKEQQSLVEELVAGQEKLLRESRRMTKEGLVRALDNLEKNFTKKMQILGDKVRNQYKVDRRLAAFATRVLGKGRPGAVPIPSSIKSFFEGVACKISPSKTAGCFLFLAALIDATQALADDLKNRELAGSAWAKALLDSANKLKAEVELLEKLFEEGMITVPDFVEELNEIEKELDKAQKRVLELKKGGKLPTSGGEQ